MSIECGECERDLRGGHDESCSRHPSNRIESSPIPLTDIREEVGECVVCGNANPSHFDHAAPFTENYHTFTPRGSGASDELVERVARDRRMMTDPQRMLWRDDVEGICPSIDVCFEHGGRVRCGPCAIKQADVCGVGSDLTVPNLPEVSRLTRELKALVDALENARLQLEYLDERSPTGTTGGVLAQIAEALAQHRRGS